MTKKRLRIKKSFILMILLSFFAVALGVSMFFLLTSKPIGEKLIYQKSFKAYQTELHQEVFDIKNSYPSLTYNEMTINNIPVIEVYEDDNTVKPLAVVIHGLNGYKEANLYLLSRLAENGFFAISYDLYGFGERYSRMITLPEIVSKSGKDIDVLVDYYKNNELINTTNYGITSVSLGGLITYWIGAYANNKPTIIAPAASTPVFENIYNDYLILTSIDDYNMSESYLSYDQTRNLYAINSPTNNSDAFMDMVVYAGHGLEDQLIQYYDEYYFIEELKNRGHKDAELLLFENVGHYYPDGFVGKMLVKFDEVLK